MDKRTEKRQTKKKRKWPYWVGGIIVLFILVVGIYVLSIYGKVEETVANMHGPLARDEDPDRQKELASIVENKKSINILFLGVDQREHDVGRSDTMIIMSLNPRTNKTVMVSIPRDTYVDIAGRGMDKINHAYAFGGVDLSVKTVEKAFDIPVHFYVKVNMQGFTQGIDALGGVTVTNDLAFSQGGKDFPIGTIHLSGDEALKYIRMRKNDPRGDLGRNERQRSVIKAAMDKAASFSSLTKVSDILSILGSNVKTNLNMDKMKTLFTDYRDARRNMETLEISGDGKIINEIWYYIVQDQEFNRITQAIRKNMEAN